MERGNSGTKTENARLNAFKNSAKKFGRRCKNDSFNV